MSPDRVYRVSLAVAIKASNPVEAAHLFSQTVGKPGFDQFQVTDDQGDTNIVDMGLLFKLGILSTDTPTPDHHENAVEQESVNVSS